MSRSSQVCPIEAALEGDTVVSGIAIQETSELALQGRDAGNAAGNQSLDTRHQAPFTSSVSIIIVCHNDGVWLSNCLQSIRTQTMASCEVIVVDNSSTDGTAARGRELVAELPNGRFLQTGGDHGFGVGCRIGALAAAGKYLYFLNPDVWLEPGCIEALYRTAESQHAGAVGGMVLQYESNEVQARHGSGIDFFGDSLPDNKGSFVLSCFYFVRRESYVKVGGHDEKLFLYGEELDLAWRLWVCGERIVVSPSAVVHHQDTSGTGNAQRRFLANRNRLVCIAKNSEHVLLLALVSSTLLILGEGVLTFLATFDVRRSAKVSLVAIISCWNLRGHIRRQRRELAARRVHGDFWMLRFLRLGFGRWHELKRFPLIRWE